MRRALCLVVCLSSFAFAQNSKLQVKPGNFPTTAMQVVYVIDGSTLTTYDVDSQTLQATQVGTITLQESNYPAIATSPDGRFLYYGAYADGNFDGHRLYVYDTNSSGAPSQSPSQTIIANQLFGGPLVHPNGQFLYAVAVGPIGAQATANYVIVRNVIDQNTGRIGQPVTEASYQLPDVDDAGYCTLNILGFAPGAGTMYDDVYCTYPLGTTSVTYNERSVNSQSGALGPDQEIYFWNYEGGGENVQFQNNMMFDFAQPAEYEQNSVTVYQAQVPLGAPVVNCTASMFTICSDFQYGLADPSGRYAFLIDPSNITDVEEVDAATQQLVQTSTIPYNVQQFSPDGTIAYGTVGAQIEISGFNASNGQVTAGGAINIPSSGDAWFTAERY
jgi:hypothetical protein